MIGFVGSLGAAKVTPRRVAVAPRRARAVVSMTKEQIREQITTLIKEAEDAANKYGKSSKQVAALWDEVEELSAELSHEKAIDKGMKGQDPLSSYCANNPEADECREYDD